MNPYVTILVLGMAAVGVVCMVDKCRTMCEEKMQMMREKLPVMFREEEWFFCRKAAFERIFISSSRGALRLFFAKNCLFQDPVQKILAENSSVIFKNATPGNSHKRTAYI